VLSPAGVPRDLLYGSADPDGLEPSVHDPAVASRHQELLAGLADTSLIGFSEDGSTVLMHRLVQRVLRDVPLATAPCPPPSTVRSSCWRRSMAVFSTSGPWPTANGCWATTIR